MGVFGLLYVQIWNPSWNPFRPIPSVVLAKMALKMKGLETFHVEGEIRAENIKKTSYEYKPYELGINERISSNESEDNFKISLDINRNDPENQESHLIAEGESYSNSQYGNSSSSYGASGKIELKKIDDLIYFILINNGDKKLTEETEVFLDRWIKVNQEDIGKVTSLFLEETAGRIKVNLTKEKQEELIKALVKLSVGRDLFEAKEELPDEKIDGQISYHYSLILNKRETKRLISDMVLEIAKFISDSVSISESTSSEYFQESYLGYFPMMVAGLNMEIQDKISEFFDQMKGINIEVWIGQKDGYLSRIKFEREVDLVNYFEEKRSQYSNEKILEAKRLFLIDVNFSEFNQPIKIDPPEKFEDLERIIRDARRESDIKGIHSSVKSFYHINQEYPRFGEYEGTGLGVVSRNKEIEVAFVAKDSPADKVGLKSGDKIIKINGVSTVGMTVGNVGNLLSGPEGTVLNLIVYRDEWGMEKNIKITRAVVEAPLIGYSYYSNSISEIKDPGDGPCLSYQQIPNKGNLQKYCVWACLENGKFFAANEKETKLLDTAPTSLDCW